MRPLDLRHIRNRVRRRLGRVPASDIGVGPVGDGISTQPRPMNIEIDEGVEEALAEINRRANVSVQADPIAVSIAAQTANGPYRVGLDNIGRNSQSGDIRRVSVAWWNDGSTNHHLIATSREEMDRDRSQWWNDEPSSPVHWWIDGYTFHVHPAPDAAITLYLVASVALRPPFTDDDIIGGLAGDEYPILCDIVARDIAAYYPNDAEMQARLQILAPKGEAGIQELIRAVATRNGAKKPQFAAFSYRR